MVQPSALPGMFAKTQHDSEIYRLLGKDAILEMAVKLWKCTRDVIHDDDALLSRLEHGLREVKAAAKKARSESEEFTVPQQPGKDASAEELRAFRAVLVEARTRMGRASEANNRLIEGLYFHAMIAYADGQVTALGLSRWADNGFPQVTMGHKFCAALLCTGMGEDVLEYVKPPWSAFFIEVPDGMLPVDSERFGRTEIRRILVLRMKSKRVGEAWAYVAFTETVMSLWRFGVTTAELLPPTLENSDYLCDDPSSEALTTQDERVTTLLGRLIINTCLAMSDRNAIKKVGPGHKTQATSWNKRTEREPIVRTFQVGQPVKLDVREQVRAFIAGSRGGSAPNVQVRVRGHFKTQHHGPQNALVKIIWRQPFWRGPEDAPILVRPHALEKKEH